MIRPRRGRRGQNLFLSTMICPVSNNEYNRFPLLNPALHDLLQWLVTWKLLLLQHYLSLDPLMETVPPGQSLFLISSCFLQCNLIFELLLLDSNRYPLPSSHLSLVFTCFLHLIWCGEGTWIRRIPARSCSCKTRNGPTCNRSRNRLRSACNGSRNRLARTSKFSYTQAVSRITLASWRDPCVIRPRRGQNLFLSTMICPTYQHK